MKPLAPASSTRSVLGLTPRLRVLLVNQYYRPDTAATAQRLTDLAESLALDCDVTVLAGRPSYDPLPSGPPAPTARARVVRAPCTAFRRYRMAGRLANYFSYLAAAALMGPFTGRADVVVAGTDPPVVGLVGWALSRLRGAPLVQVVEDLHPQAAVASGLLRSRLPISFLGCASTFVLRRAARTVALSETMRSAVIAAGAPPGRVEVIPNWEDLEVVRPEPRDNPFSRQHGLVDRFVVMYAGNLGHAQGLESVVQLAEDLRDLPELVVVLVGEGAAKAILQGLVQERGLGNVRFLPYEPRDRMRYSLATADVGLVPLARGLDGFVVPSKVYTIMASGRPFVASAPAGSEIDALVGRFACGVRVEPGDRSGLAEAVRSLHRDRDAARAMGERGRQAAERWYSREVVLARYRALLHAVAAEGRGDER